jgi:hypothetical protein
VCTACTVSRIRCSARDAELDRGSPRADEVEGFRLDVVRVEFRLLTVSESCCRSDTSRPSPLVVSVACTNECTCMSMERPHAV